MPLCMLYCLCWKRLRSLFVAKRRCLILGCCLLSDRWTNMAMSLSSSLFVYDGLLATNKSRHSMRTCYNVIFKFYKSFTRSCANFSTSCAVNSEVSMICASSAAHRGALALFLSRASRSIRSARICACVMVSSVADNSK